jgi:hypothetical protein
MLKAYTATSAVASAVASATSAVASATSAAASATASATSAAASDADSAASDADSAATHKNVTIPYFIYKSTCDEIPGFTYNVEIGRWECVYSSSEIFVSEYSYSFWDRFSDDIPFNPWDQTRDDDEYNSEHEDEIVCFVYRIENSEFTTADVLASKYDEELYGEGKSYNCNINVFINGKPANYKFTARFDIYAADDCNTVINFDNCKFNGFPHGIHVDIKEVARRGYYNENSTWALSSTP